MAWVLGVDPGLDGALAFYNPLTGEMVIEDVPTLQVGKKRVLDLYKLAGVFDAWAEHKVHAWIEYVSASSQMGVTSAFCFGETAGSLKAMVAAHFIPMDLVTPPSWKRAMGVKGEKDESRARASAMLPQHARQWPLKKHHGRAEAALIALYGARQSERAAA